MTDIMTNPTPALPENPDTKSRSLFQLAALRFRRNKAGYGSIRTKHDLFAIIPTSERVQEIYLCPEFERRTPGTGYRG